MEYPHDYPEVEVTRRAPERVAPRAGAGRDAGAQTGGSSITFVRSLYYIVKVALALLVASLRRYPRVKAAHGMTPIRHPSGRDRLFILVVVVVDLLRGSRSQELYGSSGSPPPPCRRPLALA